VGARSDELVASLLDAERLRIFPALHPQARAPRPVDAERHHDGDHDRDQTDDRTRDAPRVRQPHAPNLSARLVRVRVGRRPHARRCSPAVLCPKGLHEMEPAAPRCPDCKCELDADYRRRKRDGGPVHRRGRRPALPTVLEPDDGTARLLAELVGRGLDRSALPGRGSALAGVGRRSTESRLPIDARTPGWMTPASMSSDRSDAHFFACAFGAAGTAGNPAHGPGTPKRRAAKLASESDVA
jgi:hypothetical protein